MSWPRRMRSQSVRISSLNWSVGGWRARGNDLWDSLPAGAGARLQGGLPCGERPGLGRGLAAMEAAWFLPARLQDSESRVGIGCGQRPRELTGRWWLPGSDAQNLTWCSWES